MEKDENIYYYYVKSMLTVASPSLVICSLGALFFAVFFYRQQTQKKESSSIMLQPVAEEEITMLSRADTTKPTAAAVDSRWILNPHEIGFLPPPCRRETSAAAAFNHHTPSPTLVSATLLTPPPSRLLHHSTSAHLLLQHQHASSMEEESKIIFDDSVDADDSDIVSVAAVADSKHQRRRASLAVDVPLLMRTMSSSSNNSNKLLNSTPAMLRRSLTQPLREHHIDGDENAPLPAPVALYHGMMLSIRFVPMHNNSIESDGVETTELYEKFRQVLKEEEDPNRLDNSASDANKNYREFVKSNLLTRTQIDECRAMQQLEHDNVNTFAGVAFTTDASTYTITTMLAFQHVPRATLASALRSYDDATRATLADWSIRHGFIDDIVRGLHYLHTSANSGRGRGWCRFHGRLSSDTIVLDWRWCAKLTDFGMWSFDYRQEPVHWLQAFSTNDSAARKLLWVAPELLRVPELLGGIKTAAMNESVAQKADIYSLGIVMSELLYNCSPPYSDTGLQLRHVVDAVKCGIVPKATNVDGVVWLNHSTQQKHHHHNSSSSSRLQEGKCSVLRPCHESFSGDAFDNNREHLAIAEKYRKLMQQCWRESPSERPDMLQILDVIDEEEAPPENHPHAPLNVKFSSNNDRSPVQLARANTVAPTSTLFSQSCNKIVQRLDKYAHALEGLVERRTRELLEEKLRADALLARLMPIPIAERLKRGEPIEPEYFASATVFFSDVVGFTTIAAHSTPMQIVRLLNELYSKLDAICNRYNVYKLETVGDAYVVLSGVPVRHARHAPEICAMALDFQALVQRQFNVDRRVRNMPKNECIQMRMGINTGPLVAAVIGTNMPRYCMFGDTMNVGSRMESHGAPMKIQLSYATKVALEAWNVDNNKRQQQQQQQYQFVLEERGMCNVKGKGKMLTYWLHPPSSSSSTDLPLPPTASSSAAVTTTTTATVIATVA